MPYCVTCNATLRDTVLVAQKLKQPAQLRAAWCSLDTKSVPAETVRVQSRYTSSKNSEKPGKKEGRPANSPSLALEDKAFELSVTQTRGKKKENPWRKIDTASRRDKFLAHDSSSLSFYLHASSLVMIFSFSDAL